MPRTGAGVGAGARTIFSTGAVLLALVAAPAQACDEPRGSSPAVSAKPGAEVAYEVPNTLEGALYTLTAEGRTLASGGDPGGEKGVSGSFTMPDLGGDARRIEVRVAVEHAEDGAAWSTSMPVDYEPQAVARPSDEPRSPRAPAAPAAAAPAPPGPLVSAPLAGLAPRADGEVRGFLPGVRMRSLRKVATVLGRLVPTTRSAVPRRGRRGARGKERRRKRNTFSLGSIGLKEPAKARPRVSEENPSLAGGVPGFGVPVAWRGLLAFTVIGFLFVLTLRAVALARARRRVSGP